MLNEEIICKFVVPRGEKEEFPQLENGIVFFIKLCFSVQAFEIKVFKSFYLWVCANALFTNTKSKFSQGFKAECLNVGVMFD